MESCHGCLKLCSRNTCKFCLHKKECVIRMIVELREELSDRGGERRKNEPRSN